jgi:uncharacterized protein YjbJ (UPF0337 family)
MNRNEFESNWNQFKAQIPEKWKKFTSEEISRLDGRYDPFLGHLQKKYGLTREKAEEEIKNWHLAAKEIMHQKMERIEGKGMKGHEKQHKHDKKRK